ncbi:MAG: dihydropteroate synthase [Proteobacteria bacterium]|nr:dihydropteroate synthase [Pseudomonadota bacterium]
MKESLVEEGADIIDIGAASSRPGANPVDPDLEWRRLEPVLAAWTHERVPARLSLDTCHAQTMLRALAYPVDIINDIRGGADTSTLEILGARGLTYLAMHMHADPLNMQERPLDGREALVELAKFYQNTEQKLTLAGFSPDRIWLDPGIGFGKTDRANLLLMRQALAEAGQRSIALGISRKSFMGRLLGIDNPRERDAPTKMLELSFLFAGIRVIRTHEVARLHKFRELLDIDY